VVTLAPLLLGLWGEFVGLDPTGEAMGGKHEPQL